MAKFVINWSEKKTTKNGKEVIEATLIQEDGTLFERVTIWNDFPGFENLKTGHEIEGNITPAKDPKYGPTLYPIRAPQVSNSSRGGGKPAMIEKAMEKKQEGIKEAQDNKGMGIKIASTLRMAVDLAIAEGDHSVTNIRKWRAWTWNEWEKTNADFPPFNN